MRITEVRIKLVEESNERLLAFCSIIFDNCFIIRDLKILEGPKGRFIAMPSRKLKDYCPECDYKNHLCARFCNQCGRRLDEERAFVDHTRTKLHTDIAHPIDAGCREWMERIILEEYQKEKIRAKQPGYVCRYDEYSITEEST